MPSSAHSAPHLHYRYPPSLAAGVGWAALLGRRRAFGPDAVRLLRTIQPPPQVEGLELVPHAGSFVTVFNHYYSSTFPSWWGPIVLTALFHALRPLGPQGIHWVMTDAWTYPDRLRQLVCTPLSHWAFLRLAHTYDLLPMPPMPPRPQEVEARARSVRQALAAVQQESPPIFGISPEGHDSPGAALMVPPAGVGRFLLHLGASGLAFLPVGVYEEGAQLQVRFGPPFRLQPPPGLPKHVLDRWSADRALLAIGRLLPPAFWGAYRERLAAGDTGA